MATHKPRQDEMKICTCGKSKDVYDGPGVKVALAVWIALLTLFGFAVQSVEVIVFLGLVLIFVYFIIFCVNKARGHSLSCSVRKSFFEMNELTSMIPSF